MSKRIGIIVLIVLIITAVIVVVVLTREPDSNNNITTGEENQVQNEVAEKFVDILSDGTKVNNSAKLSETKKIGALEISGLQLTVKDNQTVLLGVIKNNTNQTQGGYLAKLTIVDETGNTIVELDAYINELKAGEEQQFNVSSTLDYANAYDVILERK